MCLPSAQTARYSDVDDPVGRAHHVLVVLHHDDRVAHVAQLLQRVDEPLVVALMQSDGRLVEDVEHIDQLATNLRGQSDALALTTRECGRLPVEREVIESHLQEEADPRPQLLDDLVGDAPLLVVEVLLHVVEPLGEVADVERRHLGDVLIPYLIGQALLLQSLALTLGAYRLGKKLRRPLLRGGRVVVLHDRLEVLNHPVESHEIIA